MKHLLKLILVLAVLATLGGLIRAEAADKATPTPNPNKPAINLNSSRSNVYKEQTPRPSLTPNKATTTVRWSKSNASERTAGDKVTPSPTPKPNEATTVSGSRSNGSYRTAASPTPTPKAK
jgi:hypothetical protein